MSSPDTKKMRQMFSKIERRGFSRSTTLDEERIQLLKHAVLSPIESSEGSSQGKRSNSIQTPLPTVKESLCWASNDRPNSGSNSKDPNKWKRIPMKNLNTGEKNPLEIL